MVQVARAQWFSAGCRLLIVEGDTVTSEAFSVVLVRAKSYDDALREALVRGRRQERSYINLDGIPVRWVLAEIETLDLVGHQLVDGREVYAEFREARSPEVPTLDPGSSSPTNTGI